MVGALKIVRNQWKGLRLFHSNLIFGWLIKFVNLFLVFRISSFSFSSLGAASLVYFQCT